jgi:hypothetical protein
MSCAVRKLETLDNNSLLVFSTFGGGESHDSPHLVRISPYQPKIPEKHQKNYRYSRMKTCVFGYFNHHVCASLLVISPIICCLSTVSVPGFLF